MRPRLFRLAVFRAKDHLRRRARRREEVWDDTVLEGAGDLEAPAGLGAYDADHKNAVAAVYRAMDKMKADDRLFFSMRVLDGQKLTDIGLTMGVSLATTKRRVEKARARFPSLRRQRARPGRLAGAN